MELTITRIFDAQRDRVWKAWTDPEIFMKWWGPKYFSCPLANLDLRIGGKYLVAMRGPDGKDFYSTGTYREIVPLEKIAVTDSFADEKGNAVPASFYGMGETFPREMKVTITFEDHDGKTKMTLNYPTTEGIDTTMLDNMKQGWNQSFDKLAESLK